MRAALNRYDWYSRERELDHEFVTRIADNLEARDFLRGRQPYAPAATDGKPDPGPLPTLPPSPCPGCSSLARCERTGHVCITFRSFESEIAVNFANRSKQSSQAHKLSLPSH